MKPIAKGTPASKFAAYEDAKPELLDRLGLQCSYCGRGGDPQDLHVEHIYPRKPHPKRECDWDNFLLACNSCNSYKNNYLGSGRQRDLLRRFLWPHLDNTSNAFAYLRTGEVRVAITTPRELVLAAEKTRDMVGLIRSPAKAQDYQALGIAYDGANKRSQVWGEAETFLQQYQTNATAVLASLIARNAIRIGYFDVWMAVFSAHVQVRRELIAAFKADPACFDPNTQPIRRGRL